VRKFRISKTVLLAGAGALAISGATGLAIAKAAPKAAASEHQVVTGPVAEYWVSTTTSTGMTLSGMAGGGGRPSLGSMMNMMKGGVTHTLRLQLGSSQAAAGDPGADHLPPAALGAGNDLPLYYKAPAAQKPAEYQPSEDRPQQGEPPKGKILIFWGCGEHAPAGQPMVIDLSKLTDPAARMAMVSKMIPAQPVALDAVHPPSPDRWKSYGEWPNEKSRTGLDGNSSLLGAHVVKGNYSPQINFTLAQTQDFMAPIQVTGNTRDATGAVPLQWQSIPGARGIIASVMGSGGKDADGGAIIVMWTSAQSQIGWTGLAADYLTPHDEERLVASKILLPGEATSCTVPAEVASPAGAHGEAGLLYTMTAYGGEANFAYPPRPEDPKTPWNIQWETKVRYKTTTGGLLGRNLGGGGGAGFMGMGGGDAGAASAGASSSAAATDNGKKKKSSLFGDMVKSKLGSMLPGGGG